MHLKNLDGDYTQITKSLKSHSSINLLEVCHRKNGGLFFNYFFKCFLLWPKLKNKAVFLTTQASEAEPLNLEREDTD